MLAAVAMPACSQPAVCDGVTREAGGCTADQPTFVAADCPALGREFAEQYENRLTKIFEEGEREGATASVHAMGMQTLMTVRMQQHMREHELRCEPEELLDIVVGQLSPSFRAEAPQYLDDRAISMDPADYEPASWEEYEAELLQSLGNVEWWAVE